MVTRLEYCSKAIDYVGGALSTKSVLLSCKNPKQVHTGTQQQTPKLPNRQQSPGKSGILKEIRPKPQKQKREGGPIDSKPEFPHPKSAIMVLEPLRFRGLGFGV